MEWAELEGPYKDYQVQLTALHSTIPKSIGQMLLSGLLFSSQTLYFLVYKHPYLQASFWLLSLSLLLKLYLFFCEFSYLAKVFLKNNFLPKIAQQAHLACELAWLTCPSSL